MRKGKTTQRPHAGSVLQAPGIDRYRQRVLVAMLVVAGAFVVLLGRLFYLQVIRGEIYRQQSETNSIRLETIAPTRGLIFDRNGTLLVDNRPAFDLTIVPRDAQPLPSTVAVLSRYVDVPADALMETIQAQRGRSSYKPVVLLQDVGREVLATVEAHRYVLPGVAVQVRPTRHYLYGSLAAHLMGYLGEISAAELAGDRHRTNRAGDFVGKVGIEKIYEPYLRGARGGRQVEVNAVGQVMRVLKTVPAVPGGNLHLTIDMRLQAQAEQLLGGRAGAVVAMIPDTGEVLALASSPAFDPNAFVCGLSREQWKELSCNVLRPLENKAIQGEYPPASVYKLVTALAGLEEDVIDEETTYHCPGHYVFGDRTFRCWRRWGHGEVALHQAIGASCDVYFYQVGQQLGVDRLAWYATGCGLGSPTGIDLDHEAAGLIPTAAWKRRRFNDVWHGGETLSIAIGQGFNLVTPLQAAVLTAAIANNGERFKPGLVRWIRSPEGETLYEGTPVSLGRLPVSAQSLGIVQRAMRGVVADPTGTARIANLEAVAISGKTGTAQVVGRREDGAGEGADVLQPKDHAWFVAYAPSAAPQVAVAVLVEHGEHGSSTAAPIARDLIRTYLLGDTGASPPAVAPES